MIELLQEWPENPILLQILNISKRILKFSISSPLMKIVSGLEILLKKAQEWESFASKKISLQGYYII